MTIRQKLGMILEKEVLQKLKLVNNVFYKKKCLLKGNKKSIDFCHQKSTLKVQFWNFLTICHSSTDFLKFYSFDYVRTYLDS